MRSGETGMAVRAVLALAVSILLCLPPGHAGAEPPGKRLPRIGYLHLGPRFGMHDRDFFKELAGLGYVDGKTVTIINRFGPRGREGSLDQPAAELVRLKVDVIVALVPTAVRSAIRATRTVPIVMRYTSDPIRAGLVTSLARPGGNVTGVTSISSNLAAKRIELLKEVIPGITRVGVLLGARRRATPTSFRLVEDSARLMGVTIQPLRVRKADDIDSIVHAASDSGLQGLLVLRDPIIVHRRRHVADLTIRNHLPTVFDERQFAEVGGLVSYGADLGHLYRRAADYVDRILKGAKPADLPIEQPTRFELVVNLKTARALGIAIPRSILLRADEVIE